MDDVVNPDSASQPPRPRPSIEKWWSVQDECKYYCMMKIEKAKVAAGRGAPIVQYYGKWPFERLFFVQEPLSALFSLLNGFGHFVYFWDPVKRRAFSHSTARDDDLLRKVLLTSNVVAMGTWGCSVIFHTKDNWITERMDYHMATLHMLTYLLLAVIRLLHHFYYPRRPDLVEAWGGLAAAVGFAWAAHHIWWLNFVSFSYGYNIKATAAVIVLQALLWLAWAGFAVRRGNAPHAWMVVRFQFALALFGVFELYDFPPLGGYLDSHSLWHLVTAPMVLYWYKFQVADAAYRRREGGDVKQQ